MSVIHGDESGGVVQPTSQETFISTQFEQSQWARVGEVPEDLSKVYQFQAEEFSVLPSKGDAIDPMFRDFGGRQAGAGEVFWHTDPEGLKQAMAAREQIQEELPPSVTMLEQELAELISEKQQEAFLAGVEQGKAETQALIEQSLGSIRQVIQSFEQQVDGSVREIEEKATQFCLALVEGMVRLVIDVNPTVIIQLMQEGLKRINGSKVLLIRISPKDFEMLSKAKMAEMEQISNVHGGIEFVADESVAMGCIIETNRGSIEVELEQAITRIRASLGS